MIIDCNDYRIDLASDLFKPNDCINLSPMINSDVSPQLACVTFSRPVLQRERADIVWDCVNYVWNSVLCHLQPLACWLYACICGPDTRILRYRGLWKMFAELGVQKTARSTKEVLIDNHDGTICFYGATAIEEESMESIRPVVTPASRSFLALLPNNQTPNIDVAIDIGWKQGLSDFDELRDIAVHISKQGGIVIRLFGEFDDQEAGVDCIMSTSIYKCVLALLGKVS